MELRTGDWYCPNTRCGNLNFSRRNVCNLCGMPRTQGANKKPGDWNCQNCGNLNWARRTKCNICKQPKPETSTQQEL